MHPPDASLFLVVSFAAMAMVVAAVVVAAIVSVWPKARLPAALTAVAWLAVTAALAQSGVLSRFDARPPPFVVLVGAALLGAVACGLSRVGRALSTLPLWLLVGFAGFRLPLELLMHRAAIEGVMPSIMSYRGRNFDVVTGALALVVAVALRRGAPRWLAAMWLALAWVTLVNVVAIAVLASPLFGAFGDDQINTWVVYAPFVWLPTVLVAAALLGQLVVGRALWQARVS